MWLKLDEIHDINVDNAFDLLSTIGNCNVESGILELDIDLFRTLTSDKYRNDDLQSCFAAHQEFGNERFTKLWRDEKFDDSTKLFIAYIIDERVTSFGARWLAEPQILDIKEWENKNSLDNTLSENYGTCLNLFIQNYLVYDNNWTSYGNPRGYKLCPSLEQLLLGAKFEFLDEIETVKNTHTFELPF